MAFEKFSLEGKNGLITGAAGLLGVQHATALLDAGATVILTDIDAAELEAVKAVLSDSFSESRIVLNRMDVTSPEGIQTVRDGLLAAGINVNILINNAAIDPKVDERNPLGPISRLENFPLEQWDIQVAVGLSGAFLCSKIFGSHMAASGLGGVILNVASDLSVISPDQRLYRKSGIPNDLQPVKPVTYSVIKAGLIGLTRYLSTYWAVEKVRCNALSPGGVFNNQPDEFVKKLEDLVPLGRMARVNEYIETVQYLCSDASRYMTGQNIVIDGGRSVL